MFSLLVKDRFHPGRYIARLKDCIRVFYTFELRSLSELFSAFSGNREPKGVYWQHELAGLSDTLNLDRLNLPPPKPWLSPSSLPYRLAGTLSVSALLSLGGAALALPQGYESVEGNIQFQQSGNTLDISTQSQKSIAQYQQFNVGQGETVNFNLPNAQSAILNRVVGPDPSQILGKINSNGQVFLTNPNGIVFGQGAQVNVSGLLASTLSISNQDFMAGQYTFKQEQGKTSAKVQNDGSITVDKFALLAGGAVENTGTISATDSGSISLAVGKQLSVNVDANLSVQLTIDEALQETVQDAQTAIANSGTLSANNGGTVKAQARLTEDLYQRSINNTGHIEAKGLGDLTGEIVLQADKGLVVQAGTIDTSNQTGKGGTVQVLGDYVALDPGSVTNASGQTGGGEILIGGDYQGKGQTQRAKQAYVGDNAELKADAISTGNGGRVIVWADEATWFYGDISAKGGSLSGDGGLAEVSGKDMLYFYGGVNLLAAHGQKGTLLLDPENLYIMSPSLWLDASQITGLNDGQAVATWTDASGNANHATQGAGTAQPIYIANGLNGKPILRFDGSDDYLSILDSASLRTTHDYTLFVVSKSNRTTINDWERIIGKGDFSYRNYGIWASQGQNTSNMQFLLQSYGPSGNVNFSTGGVNFSQFKIISGINQSTGANIYINGSSAASSGTNVSNHTSADPFTIGYAGFHTYFGGDIAEVIVYNSAVGTTELEHLHQYLGNKYGISVPSASNTSVMTQSQIETLSLTANVVLSADKDVTFGKLNNNVLNLQGTASLTITADANNDGIGNVTMNSADTLRTEGGNISISGVDVTLGNLNTTGLSGNQTGGNILVEADKNLTVGTVTTRQAQITLSADADNNASGLLLASGQIVSNNGNINLTSAFFGLHQPVNAGTGTVRLTTTLDNFYIMSPSLWLDASQISGVSNGSLLSNWLDSSGNGLNATQGTLGNMPVYFSNGQNGLPTIKFDGNDDQLAIASSVSVNNIFVVANWEGGATFPTWNGLIGNKNYVPSSQWTIVYGNSGDTTFYASAGSSSEFATRMMRVEH